MALDIGILFSFRNPPFNRVPWPQLYKSEIGLAVAAEELGYDHVWLTEHHFVEDGYSPSLFPIASAIAAQTQVIRIGTYVMLLPLHNAVRVAEDVATVDIISNGRFDLGMGLGYRVGEFTGMGISPRERGARFQEAVPLIQRLFEGETVTFEGQFNNIKDVILTPPPVQQPMPLWVGARGDKALDRAAKMGCHLASVGAPQHRVKYLEALKKHGRNPNDHHVAQLLVAFVADTAAEAWDICAEPLNHVLQYYHDWGQEAADDTGDRIGQTPVPSADELRKNEAGQFFGQTAFIGTADQVADGISDFLDRSPGSHLALMMALPGIDPAKTRRSMELFADQVMPKLK